MAEDEFAHFRAAQAPVYDEVVRELAAGRKRSHWMWFIFPQLAGLGRSEMAQRFALHSLAQAARYTADPELGTRLRHCATLVNQTANLTGSEIFGAPDDLKFHSSMTLFALAVPAEPVFRTCLEKFFGGQEDAKTVELLKRSE